MTDQARMPEGYWVAVYTRATKLIDEQKFPAQEAYWAARVQINTELGIESPPPRS